MTARDRLHLAVSGTYSSGKTTTTETLSIATGIPRTDALTAREIVVDLMPGKQFQQLDAEELLALGLRRLEERIHTEATAQGAFISDGSVLHEWVYGEARMRLGINPGAPVLHRAAKRVAGIPARPFMKRYMNAYGRVVKARAQRNYTAFAHLPIEFEMSADGHRPVSERYRRVTDALLTETVRELGIPLTEFPGTVRQRVEGIIAHFGLPVVVPVDEAIDLARTRIEQSREALAERVIATTRTPGLRRRIGYAVRY
jgi:hypothetical protein